MYILIVDVINSLYSSHEGSVISEYRSHTMILIIIEIVIDVIKWLDGW